MTTKQKDSATTNPTILQLINDGILSDRYGRSTTDENKKHYLMADDYRASIAQKGVLTEEGKSLADDWVTIHSKSRGWEKYGRSMYSPSLAQLRAQDFDEFYDGGVVD